MIFSVKLYWTDPTTRDVLSIRRLRTPQVPTWDEFLNILKPLFPGNDDLIVTWRDEENDVISIGSQVEWDEAVESTSRPMKLFVMPGEKKEVKEEEEKEEDVKEQQVQKEEEDDDDKPTLTPEFFYSASGSTPLPQTDRQRLSAVVQNILTRYSAAPPQWLAPAIRVSPSGCDFLVDVDISQLSLLLHRRAYHLLSSEVEGSEVDALGLLGDCLSLFPNDAIAHYNRACCYARLGDVNESFNEIVKYFESGGRDFDALKSDDDLGCLRECARFVEYMKLKFNEDVGGSCVNVGASSVFESVTSSVMESRVEEEEEDEEEEEEEEDDDDDDDEDDDDEDEDDDDDDDDDEDEEDEEDVDGSCVYDSQMTESRIDGVYDSCVDVSQLDMSVLLSVPPISEPEQQQQVDDSQVQHQEQQQEEDDDDEEEEVDAELERKLDLLGELGFVDRAMVKVLLSECNGDVERFLDEQCA